MPTASKTTATSPKRAPARRAGRGLFTPITAWLTRPLASFHLLLAVFGLLTVFGLVMVLSASSVDSYSANGTSYSVFGKQVLYCLVGLGLFYLALRVPARLIRRHSMALLILCLVMLVLVLTPLGQVANGARSWLSVGGVSVQPVEFAKIGFALWGAHVLVTKRGLLSQYRHLLVPVVPAALLMFALVMLQPDLGSTMTLFIVLLGLLWFVGAPMRLFAVMALGGVTGVVVLALFEDYRMARLTVFLDPSADPTGTGYQSTQALYALADGGLFGQGLGQGWSKWQYLPYAHNDFIFAVIGEELGFLGCAVVLGLFGLTAYVGMRIARRNTDPWIRVVAGTLTLWIVTQAVVNIGYVVGMLPITGLPLPLISSGGSSIVSSMLVFGLLANFARNEPEAIAALRSLGPGRVGRLLRLPTPDPYRPPAKRRSARSSTPPSRPATKSSGATATRRGTGKARAPGARSGPGSRTQTRGGHR